MRTSHRHYYSTAAGLRQASSVSPTKRTSPSHSLPMPISHTIHYSTPVNLTNGNLIHSKESPVISLDTRMRSGQCASEKPRSTSLSSNDTGDEMFTPKQLVTGTVDISGPSSHHRLQPNSFLEKDRGRVKKSKMATNNGDEVKKKKRHLHQSVPTAQATRFPDNETLEMVKLKLVFVDFLFHLLLCLAATYKKRLHTNRSTTQQHNTTRPHFHYTTIWQNQ